MRTVCTHGEQESVFEVGELSVALLAAVESVLLVDYLLVAVCGRTRLVQTILLTDVQHRCQAGEIVRLRGEKQNGSGLNLIIRIRGLRLIKTAILYQGSCRSFPFCTLLCREEIYPANQVTQWKVYQTRSYTMITIIEP